MTHETTYLPIWVYGYKFKTDIPTYLYVNTLLDCSHHLQLNINTIYNILLYLYSIMYIIYIIYVYFYYH